MKVLFGSALLKITFEEGERFAGRKLTINGEALTCGFDAYPSSMKWLKPYEDEEIDNETRTWLMDRILEKKFEIDFKIINGEEKIATSSNDNIKDQIGL